MSAEAAFLEALKAAPADDTARLVYADWLDEHGRAHKAEYLRLVVALTRTCEDATYDQPEVNRLLSLANVLPLPLDWRTAAGSRFMLVYYECTDATKRSRTKTLIRKTMGAGFVEAKNAYERPPSKLLACVPFEEGILARGRFLEVQGTRVVMHPCDLPLLPFTVDYNIVAYRETWLTGTRKAAAAAQGEQAFALLLQQVLNISLDAARKLAVNEQVTLANNLELIEAQRRVAAISPLIPRTYIENWRLAVECQPTARPKTPQ
jgi:uncharacterized protein (TIGR02996 family)